MASNSSITSSAEGDGRHTRYDAAGVQPRRYDVAGGWQIIKGMRGGLRAVAGRLRRGASPVLDKS
jgi:hypothetical protein